MNDTTEKVTKSIVPSKYNKKYRTDPDDLSKFISDQCTGKDGFEYTAFFALMRTNGVAEDQVKKYEDIVESKAHGGQGRARMTLRNMLETIVRKNGGAVKALDGSDSKVDLPTRVVSGAAAARAAQTAAPTEGSTEAA